MPSFADFVDLQDGLADMLGAFDPSGQNDSGTFYDPTQAAWDDRGWLRILWEGDNGFNWSMGTGAPGTGETTQWSMDSTFGSGAEMEDAIYARNGATIVARATRSVRTDTPYVSFGYQTTSNNAFAADITNTTTIIGFSGPSAGALDLRMTNLPTANPATAGRLWNDSGTLKVSAG